MLLTSIIIVQNSKSLIILLKYLSQRNSDIEDTENIEVLSSIKIYILRFKHVYWKNLIKICVEKTKSCFIKFMSLYNNLKCLIRYLI